MSRLPLLLGILLAAAAAWLLLRGEPEPEPEAPEVGEHAATGDGPGARLSAQPQPPGPGARGTGPRASVPRPGLPVSIDANAIPRGPLEVHVLGVDEQPIHSDEVTVDVGPVPGAPTWHSQPLLRPDPKGHVWQGDDVFAGRVLVRVWGLHVVEQTEETVVETSPTPPLRVLVERAGSIEYTATLLDGSEPAEVRLTLIGGRKQPVPVYYQVRTETMLTQARRLTEIVQGPRGVIFGIRPGTYTLRASTLTTDETDVQQVVIEPQKTLSVALRLTR